jgi:hypothetical protein
MPGALALSRAENAGIVRAAMLTIRDVNIAR